MNLYGIIVSVFVLLMFVQTSFAQCDGDRNAIMSDCRNTCFQNCVKSVACTLDCEFGCSCKQGYLFDGARNRCVTEDNCSNKQ